MTIILYRCCHLCMCRESILQNRQCILEGKVIQCLRHLLFKCCSHCFLTLLTTIGKVTKALTIPQQPRKMMPYLSPAV
ncbi:hypothetical protein EB796_014121 [Bugula neritina]|uniref:Uncharacterized protein n=1 Tax=Bugula neritina TaxID=10212 RepID=A0A7J7JNJ2_BUGNE|nr:hypothetical protein EB796_014121 [Bugula neritina]